VDEPLAQLDPALKLGLRREIQRLQRELNIPAVLVTHDQDEALELADRIAVLRGGRLEQVGSPEQMHGAPVNPFVAEFFNPAGINRLEGTVERDGQGPWFRADGLRLPMPASLAVAAATGRRLLFLRPESIRVFPVQGSDTGVMVRPEPAGETALDGTVSRALRLGWERRIELESAGRTWLARTTDVFPVEAGQPVRWTIRWTEALWFDAGY
jgi:multiple sugar transport system ATP-binding protein